MNLAHVHLLLNHIPVMGITFGVLLLLLAFARRSEELKKVGLGVFVVTGALAVPTYFTGEPAEKVVERLPGVSSQIIERHEGAALIALIAASVVGALALAALLYFRAPKTLPAWAALSALVLSLVVGGLMARAANFGGMIRHSEIRSGSVPGPSPNDVTSDQRPGAAQLPNTQLKE